jgi:hypothetical protein
MPLSGLILLWREVTVAKNGKTHVESIIVL